MCPAHLWTVTRLKHRPILLTSATKRREVSTTARCRRLTIFAFLGSALLAAFLLLLSVSAAKFLLVPFVRWMLVSTFQALADEEGLLRTVRQILSYPVRALLGRQRKARHGDIDSEFELFFIDITFGLIVSSILQGFWLTLLTAFCIGVLVVIGVVVADA